MGCLGTVIGFFIVMGALAAFEAVFFALPLIGAVILYIYFSKYTEIPKWWKVLTIVMGAASTALFAVDVFDKTIHIGPAPFLLFSMYGVLSAIFFAVKRKTSGSTFFPRSNADGEDINAFSQAYDETIVTDSDEDENDDDLLDEEVKTKALCEKLKQNFKVDTAFWKERHLDFKCNLTSSYTMLYINFEIKHTSGTRWQYKDGGLTIKVNAYDAEENLLYMDDLYLDNEDLKHNRFSDYLLLNYEDVKAADSLEMYAYWEE